jgi:hypothetical protein
MMMMMKVRRRPMVMAISMSMAILGKTSQAAEVWNSSSLQQLALPPLSLLLLQLQC